MTYAGYDLLRARVERGVAFVTIDHPPINLFDLPLMQELLRMGGELAADDAVRVVVVDSANPEFFIAHADVHLIRALPADPSPRPEALSPFQQMVDRFRTMPKATIAKIEGRTRGGGSEFVLAFDMRFGALGRALLAQPEVALGLIPGGGATQRLPRLVGRARALEIILGCEDIPAELAAQWGYLNRALAPDALTPFVDALAFRIASFPAHAIAQAKEAVAAAERALVPGLLEEAHLFNCSLGPAETQARMARFLELGGQTRDGELDLNPLVSQLG